MTYCEREIAIENKVSLNMFYIWPYWKNGTQDPERTQDQGSYEDPGPYAESEFFDDPGKAQKLIN